MKPTTTARAGRKPVAPIQPPLNLQMPEGVHLRMPDAAYFDARAIGSSDLKTLYWQPESWWFSSWLNTRRAVKLKSSRKAHFDVGQALHALVLEGEAAYASRFAFEPDEDSGHWLRTPLEVKAALEHMGCDVRRVFGAQLMQLARAKGISNQVWDLAWANFDALKRAGRPYLSEADDARVRHTARLIAQHPQLGPAMSTDGLSEVAVFWRRPEDPETLLRAKFDRLRLRRIFDLKHIGNGRGRNIDAMIAAAIEEHDYGIQRRFYAEAFEYFCRFVLEGRIHGWNPEGEAVRVLADDRALLTRFAEAGAAEWVWIFVQLRSDAYGQERAPMVVPRWHAPRGRLWDEAGDKIEEALASYRRLRSTFGIDTPWAMIDELRELVDADIRSRLKKEIV